MQNPNTPIPAACTCMPPKPAADAPLNRHHVTCALRVQAAPTPTYLYVFRCANGNYSAVTAVQMIDRTREPLYETPQAAIDGALVFIPHASRPNENEPDPAETERIEGYDLDIRAYLVPHDGLALQAAIGALRNAHSTYVRRHAAAIAAAALAAPTDAAAAAAVLKLIGHTSVGARRSHELAMLARLSAVGRA